MDFSVTVLGSNSAVPAHNRNQTSQVVTMGSHHFLVDCGEGTQIQLRKFKIKFSRINHIFISHLHGDHYLGLMGVITSFHLHKRQTPLTIFGPQGLDEIITTHLRHGNTKLGYPLRFVPTNPGQNELILDEKHYSVYSFPLKHRLPCTGFYFEEKPKARNLIKEKIQEGKLSIEAINTLKKGDNYVDAMGNIIYAVEEYAYPADPVRNYAFCSDTIYDPELIPFLKGVNMLYHEATFMSNEEARAKETYHSTAAQAAAIARDAEVKKLLLGHFSTRYIDLSMLLMEAQEVFAATSLGIEGETYPIE